MNGAIRNRDGHLTTLRHCDVCGVEYQAVVKELNRGWGRYCGKSCSSKARAPSNPAFGIRRLTEEQKRRDAVLQRNRSYRRTQQLRRTAFMTPERKKLEATASTLASYYRNKEPFYRAAYKRRARQKAAEYEYIRRTDVFEQEGWRCRYCKVRVRDDVPRGHPKKAIMAHIVALAAGGSHTRDNVACLCHNCNSRDGVNKLPIQKAFQTG